MGLRESRTAFIPQLFAILVLVGFVGKSFDISPNQNFPTNYILIDLVRFTTGVATTPAWNEAYVFHKVHYFQPAWTACIYVAILALGSITNNAPAPTLQR